MSRDNRYRHPMATVNLRGVGKPRGRQCHPRWKSHLAERLGFSISQFVRLLARGVNL